MKDIFFPDYILVYPDIRKGETEPSGGYVEVHITHHSHESARNTETAVFLAKRGYKVRLLPIDNTPGVKNPDAYLLDEQLIIEFKHNYTPTASAIEEAIRKGRKQADNLVIHILSDIPSKELIAGIRNRMYYAQNVQKIWLIRFDELVTINRNDVFDGTIALKIK